MIRACVVCLVVLGLSSCVLFEDVDSLRVSEDESACPTPSSFWRPLPNLLPLGEGEGEGEGEGVTIKAESAAFIPSASSPLLLTAWSIQSGDGPSEAVFMLTDVLKDTTTIYPADLTGGGRKHSPRVIFDGERASLFWAEEVDDCELVKRVTLDAEDIEKQIVSELLGDCTEARSGVIVDGIAVSVLEEKKFGVAWHENRDGEERIVGRFTNTDGKCTTCEDLTWSNADNDDRPHSLPRLSPRVTEGALLIYQTDAGSIELAGTSLSRRGVPTALAVDPNTLIPELKTFEVFDLVNTRDGIIDANSLAFFSPDLTNPRIIFGGFEFGVNSGFLRRIEIPAQGVTRLVAEKTTKGSVLLWSASNEDTETLTTQFVDDADGAPPTVEILSGADPLVSSIAITSAEGIGAVVSAGLTSGKTTEPFYILLDPQGKPLCLEPDAQ